MNLVHGTMLGLAITLGGWTCSAQQTAIPFGQIERDAQLTATLTLSGDQTADNLFSSSLSPGAGLSGSGGGGFRRAEPVTIHRALGSRFFLMNGLHLGTAVLDVEMTHLCIQTHHCREGNPLMPSSLAGALSVEVGLVGYGSYVSYRMKKNRSHKWWLSPAIGIAGHIVGAATGIAHH